jgi:hypothetical protein
MRCEDSPQRGQLAVSAGEWAVIVRTLSLSVTAVISHSGNDKTAVGSITAQLRMKGKWSMVYDSIPWTSHLCLSTEAAEEPILGVLLNKILQRVRIPIELLSLEYLKLAYTHDT